MIRLTSVTNTSGWVGSAVPGGGSSLCAEVLWLWFTFLRWWCFSAQFKGSVYPSAAVTQSPEEGSKEGTAGKSGAGEEASKPRAAGSAPSSRSAAGACEERPAGWKQPGTSTFSWKAPQPKSTGQIVGSRAGSQTKVSATLAVGACLPCRWAGGPCKLLSSGDYAYRPLADGLLYRFGQRTTMGGGENGNNCFSWVIADWEVSVVHFINSWCARTERTWPALCPSLSSLMSCFKGAPWKLAKWTCMNGKGLRVRVMMGLSHQYYWFTVITSQPSFLTALGLRWLVWGVGTVRSFRW